MTQEERWNTRYDEVKEFILNNHRNPSKYAPKERLMIHFLKRGRKMLNAGELQEPRLERTWLYGQWGQVSVSRCLRVHVKLLRAA